MEVVHESLEHGRDSAAMRSVPQSMRWLIASFGLFAAALRAHAAEFPPHAHGAGGGWSERDRGYVMQLMSRAGCAPS
jgi:hypothetical protein